MIQFTITTTPTSRNSGASRAATVPFCKPIACMRRRGLEVRNAQPAAGRAGRLAACAVRMRHGHGTAIDIAKSRRMHHTARIAMIHTLSMGRVNVQLHTTSWSRTTSPIVYHATHHRSTCAFARYHTRSAALHPLRNVKERKRTWEFIMRVEPPAMLRICWYRVRVRTIGSGVVIISTFSAVDELFLRGSPQHVHTSFISVETRHLYVPTRRRKPHGPW